MTAPRLELRACSLAATHALAAAVATLARPGDVILLAGEMGTGKTAFAQGFGRGLGIDEPITSPTFTLVRTYKGRLVLNHLDVYRLEGPNEAEDLAIGELLEAGVTLIEWGDTIVGALPADYLELRFTLGDGDDDRDIKVRQVGPSWSARQRSLAEAMGPWAC
jgi:tRNA threonylcarbamoyladenosine biosynthesis protein TsaE